MSVACLVLIKISALLEVFNSVPERVRFWLKNMRYARSLNWLKYIYV